MPIRLSVRARSTHLGCVRKLPCAKTPMRRSSIAAGSGPTRPRRNNVECKTNKMMRTTRKHFPSYSSLSEAGETKSRLKIQTRPTSVHRKHERTYRKDTHRHRRKRGDEMDGWMDDGGGGQTHRFCSTSSTRRTRRSIRASRSRGTGCVENHTGDSGVLVVSGTR